MSASTSTQSLYTGGHNRVLNPGYKLPKSPAPHLIHSYHAPVDKEKAQIRATISRAESDLTHLNTEISLLESKLKVHRRNRNMLKEFVDVHKSMLSPFRRLPDDLLRLIFIELFSGSSMLFPPVEVNRRWRALAISMPVLWTSLCFIWNTSQSSADKARDTEMVSLRLKRSGSLPLTIEISTRPLLAEGFFNHPAIPLLAAQSHRWEHVTLRLPYLLANELRRARGHLDILQSLHIDSTEGWPDHVTQTLNIFQTVPCLRLLVLGKKMTSRPLIIPWTQIEECHIIEGEHPHGHDDDRRTAYSMDESFVILARSPKLQIFKVLLQLPEFSASNPLITHSNLVELVILDSHADATLFFGQLELPKLRTFEYHDSSQFLSLESIASLISRSRCSLDRLVLSSEFTQTDQASLSRLFRACPELEEVDLKGSITSGITDDLLQQLTYKLSTAADIQSGSLSYINPKLRTIKFSIHENFSYQAFANMVASRWQLQPRNANINDQGNTKPLQRLSCVRIHRFQKYRAMDEPNHKNDEDPSGYHLLLDLADDGLDIKYEDEHVHEDDLYGWPFVYASPARSDSSRSSE